MKRCDPKSDAGPGTASNAFRSFATGVGGRTSLVLHESRLPCNVLDSESQPLATRIARSTYGYPRLPQRSRRTRAPSECGG